MAADEKIAPVVVPKVCLLCYEPGASKRVCCNAPYCDHCYTKDKACPNCKQATRIEKMTGATYILPSFSEHEECRACLDPGIKRRCCGSYYCDDCYYKLPACRSCDAPVGKRGLVSDALRAAFVSILLGWLLTLFITGCIVALIMVFIASEAQTPVTIYGYQCYGLFSVCPDTMCYEVPDEVASGLLPLPPLSYLPLCSDRSTTKLEGSFCVFDSQLYWASNGAMGADLCQKTYGKGVYIFEDTFESWSNFTLSSNKMQSAKWDKIVNGFATSYCGVGNHHGGKNSLSFSGAFDRFAETKDLDVTSGGWLEAELFMAPPGFDVSNPYCKSSYVGSVNADYSIDQGNTWVTLKTYPAWVWRQLHFFEVKLELPPAAWTNSTRFRFRQSFFDEARDGWALDNVKVYRYLPPDWHTSAGFMNSMKESLAHMARAQCCFDTDWCETRLSQSEMNKCTDFAWYKGRRYLLRNAEMYVAIATLLAIFKAVYVAIQEWIMHKRYPLQDEFEDLVTMDRIMKFIPARYRPKKRLEDFVGNIHKSARLVAELKDAFKDDEGDGAIVKSKEEIKEERRKEKERLKKEKKKLMKRMKKRNFKDTDAIKDLAKRQEELESSSESEEEKELVVPEGETKIATDTDKMKRQNMSMLRVPFDTKVDFQLRNYFSFTVLGIYVILFFIQLSTTSYYIVHQSYLAFGVLPGDISLTSLGINFFAFVLDGKEIYSCLKNVICARDEWVPFVTLDLSEEVNSMYIGRHIVQLAEVTETSTFSLDFISACLFSYGLGIFPFSIFSLILRNQFLQFHTMRFITPFFGLVIISRAVLGHSFIIKIIFSLYYFFAYNMKTREFIGAALQREKTINSAINTTLLVTVVATFLGSIVAFDVLKYIVAAAIGLGLIYGTLTGCIHSLPIKPWFYITTLSEGVWMRVKKKQKCPCLYNGKYCTDMHIADELFIVFTTEDIKFVEMVKGGGSAAANA